MLYTLGKLALKEPPYQHAKPLLLLSYLTLEGAQERRHLAKLFWPHSERPLNSLSALLFRLRRDVPGVISADTSFVRSTLSSDAVAFLRAAEQGLDEQALELYQGPFLGNTNVPLDSPALERWLYDTRELLSLRAYAAALRVSEALAARGELALATQQAEAALELGDTTQLDPDMLGRFYSLLYRGKSRKADALKVEAQEFGLDLSPYEQGPYESAASPTDPANAPRANLPTDDSSFIGRSRELEQLSKQLVQPECRLLTLLGPGGVGKSRLALELARQHAQKQPFQDGVTLVTLEALTSPDFIPTGIADALGLSLDGKDDPLEQVIQQLGNQHALLILDNFEHLADGAFNVSELLAGCPSLKVIVTSRVRLNLREEWVYPLEGLAYGGLEQSEFLTCDAPTLFYQRAKRTRLDFELGAEDGRHLHTLCKLVSGFPLALELAATWLRSLPLADITREVKANLDFLISLRQDASQRHQSMTAVLTQSWQRLSLSEQTVLAKLAVFEGGFSRDAAAAVADASLVMLTRLIDKSLLRRDAGGRYEFHPLTRQFAGQKLEQTDTAPTYERLSDFFLSLAEQAEPELTGPEQGVWLERLEDDLANIRLAMQFFIEKNQVEKALRLTGALGNFWKMRSYFTEGRRWLGRALALSDEKTLARARALRWVGYLAGRQADYREAQGYLVEGLETAKEIGDDAEVAHHYSDLSILTREQGNFEMAQFHAQKSLSIRKCLNDQVGVAASLSLLGHLAFRQGNHSAAQSYCKESLSISERLGDQHGTARSLNNLGVLANMQRDYAAAQHYYEKSRIICLELGEQWGVANALVNLGDIAFEEGDYQTADRFYSQSLAINLKLGDKIGVSLLRSRLRFCLGEVANRQGESENARHYLLEALELLNTPNLKSQSSIIFEELGYLAYAFQQHERAVKLLASASRLRETTGNVLSVRGASRYEEKLAALRRQLGEAAFQTAWEEGEALTLDEAIHYALDDKENLIEDRPIAYQHLPG